MQEVGIFTEQTMIDLLTKWLGV